MRDLITIEDLTNDEIIELFRLADGYLDKLSTSNQIIKGRQSLANEYILATLFYEPSTRTRLSFESAMLRLGGHVLSSPEAKATSAAKGESIADTVRVIQNYADMIVIRHSAEGAARVAADFSEVPVINAGDGSHEHPTQTLCDLYTLHREKKGKLDKLVVLICGDLKHGRTVHSLVYALARFGAHIITAPAAGLELPPHVQRRLKGEYGATLKSASTEPFDDLPIDALYQTPGRSHQLALIPDVDVQVDIRKYLDHIDVCYVTRFQRERLSEGDKDASDSYPVVNRAFLSKPKYRNTSVMHPLPRVDELGYDIDEDPRGVYFKQAAYGVPVRMALLAALLDLKESRVLTTAFKTKYRRYSGRNGVTCHNARCVTNDESERRHLVPSFTIISQQPVSVRCVYCEWESVDQVVANSNSRKYYTDGTALDNIEERNLILFATEADALAKGYHAGRVRSRATDPEEVPAR
jgi:aspartate carbamoyltransferase catalytic subunit